MKGRMFLAVMLLTIASVGGVAQTSKDTSSKAASVQIDELREKGSTALFNLDYESARQTFKEVARLFPDDPTGTQMLAWTVWLQTLNQARLRQAAIYSSQSFEANSEDKPDPRITQQFRDLIRQATQLARTRLQANSHDLQMLYTLGDLESLRGRRTTEK